MNDKLKKWGVVFLCAVLSVGVYLYVGMVLTPKDINDSGGPMYYNGMGFLAEPKDSLDVMVYGNSDVYSGFYPKVLLEEFGYTSYASGRALQNMDNINDLLKKTLERQTPKLVILETDCFYEERSQFLGDFNVFAPPFLYHARWKELTPRDFFTIPSRTGTVDASKGYIDSELVCPADYPQDYMGDTAQPPEPISRKNRRQIDLFLQTCQQHGLPVLLVELPSPHSWDYSRHNAVQALADEYGLPFLDLNAQADYPLDLATDFRDNGNHLNRIGASKSYRLHRRLYQQELRRPLHRLNRKMAKTRCRVVYPCGSGFLFCVSFLSVPFV